MDNFKRHSNYKETSSFSRVNFGANKPVLEVELNELQQIVDTKLSRIIKSLGGSYIVPLSDKSIISGNKYTDIAFGAIKGNSNEAPTTFTFSELHINGVHIPLTDESGKSLSPKLSLIDNEIQEAWNISGNDELSLTTTQGAMWESYNSISNVFRMPILTDVDDVLETGSLEVVAKVKGTAKLTEEAGLFLYIGEDNYVSIQRKNGDSIEKIYFVRESHADADEWLLESDMVNNSELYFKIKQTGSITEAYCSVDGVEWEQIGGSVSDANIIYEGSPKVVLSDCVVFEESGLTAYINYAEVELPNSQCDVYLELVEKDVDGKSELKMFGNTADVQINNPIIDNRMDIETSRRKAVTYTLKTGTLPNNTETTKYVPIGYCSSNGVFTLTQNDRLSLVQKGLQQELDTLSYNFNSRINGISVQVIDLENQLNGIKFTIEDGILYAETED